MSGVRTGLDYAGVEAAARMLGLAPDPELFGKLRVLEAQVLAVDAQRRAESKRA